MALVRLELCAGKLACTVLRGLGTGNRPWLLGPTSPQTLPDASLGLKRQGMSGRAGADVRRELIADDRRVVSRPLPDEEGLRADVEATAIKRVIAYQIEMET